MKIDKKQFICLSPFLALFLFLILGRILFFSIEAVASPKVPGILLADDQGKILYSQNKDVPYTPASIFKIFTSLAAMEIGRAHV